MWLGFHYALLYFTLFSIFEIVILISIAQIKCFVAINARQKTPSYKKKKLLAAFFLDFIMGHTSGMPGEAQMDLCTRVSRIKEH